MSDFKFPEASTEAIFDYAKSLDSTHDSHSLLADCFYWLGRNHIVYGLTTEAEVYQELSPVAEKMTELVNSNPDGAYKKLLTSCSKQLDKGIKEGSKNIKVEDKEFPLDPRIAKDFPRTVETRVRKEPSPGEAHIFMRRLVGDTIKYNIRTKTIYIGDDHLTVPERDILSFRQKYGWAPKTGYESLVYGLARKKEYDPVRDYFDTLELMDPNSQDYQDIRENILYLLFDMDPTEGNNWLYQVFLRKWLYASVMRVYKPGAKFDSVLVLQGPKGYSKSTFFNALGNGHTGRIQGVFDPTATNVDPDRWVYDINCKSIGGGSDKDTLMLCHRFFIVVLDEIDQLSSKESGMVKNFLQKELDSFRVPYGKVPEDFYRSFVFGGTTNIKEYLSDPDPDRRYLTIPITQPIDGDKVVSYRELIWRWAKTAFFYGLEVPYLQEAESQAHAKLYADHAMEGEYDCKLNEFLDLLTKPLYKGGASGDLECPAMVFKMRQLYDIFNVPNGKYHKRDFREALERHGFKHGQKRVGTQNLGEVWWHRNQDFTHGARVCDSNYETDIRNVLTGVNL